MLALAAAGMFFVHLQATRDRIILFLRPSTDEWIELRSHHGQIILSAQWQQHLIRLPRFKRWSVTLPLLSAPSYVSPVGGRWPAEFVIGCETIDIAGPHLNGVWLGLPVRALPGMSLLVAAYPMLAFVRGPVRRWQRARKGLCLTCAYNLTGNVSGVCPECGTEINKP